MIIIGTALRHKYAMTSDLRRFRSIVEGNRLDEKTTDNMRVLEDCMNLIINNMPSRFPAGVTDGIRGYDLRGLDPLIKKYQGTTYEDAIKGLHGQTFIFHNNAHRGGTAGSYIGKPRQEFHFYLGALVGSSETITKEQLLAFRGTQAIKTFRGIVLHELRHMFQSYLYSKYYDGRPDDENYKRSPVEIDAAWMHHLQDYDPTDYTMDEYVNAVMKSFSDYKHLDPPWQQHYRRKTARYYSERMKTAGDDRLKAPAKERLVIQREQVKKIILGALAGINDDIDLRKLPGYDQDARMFFLPKRVIDAVRGIIAKNVTCKPETSPLVYLPIALTIAPEAVETVRRHLRNVQKITLNDAVTNAEAAIPSEKGWDTATIVRAIERVFG